MDVSLPDKTISSEMLQYIGKRHREHLSYTESGYEKSVVIRN